MVNLNHFCGPQEICMPKEFIGILEKMQQITKFWQYNLSKNIFRSFVIILNLLIF